MADQRFIWVTFQRAGYHFYPNAPEEVAYLRDAHRHLFKFKVKIEVWHDDREIEFHMFLNKIESFYNSGVLQLDCKSCEMMADDLHKQLVEEYSAGKARMCVIEVSEDGEVGAECYYLV